MLIGTAFFRDPASFSFHILCVSGYFPIRHTPTEYLDVVAVCATRRFMGSPLRTFYGKKSSVGGGRARRASTRARRARRGLSLRLVGSQASGWWARDTCESFMSRYGAQL